MNEKNIKNKNLKKINPMNDVNSAGFPSVSRPTRKIPWMIYVTPETSEKIRILMIEHRWNRTQALDYIFEVFFNEDEKRNKYGRCKEEMKR